MKALHIFALVLLTGLAAFRPWRTVNEAVGIPALADSVMQAGLYPDSVMVAQPIQVVLPQSTVDSLATVVADKEQEKADLKAKNKKLDKELITLRKSNADKQSTLITEKEIEALVAKQNTRHGPTKDPDPDEPKK